MYTYEAIVRVAKATPNGDILETCHSGKPFALWVAFYHKVRRNLVTQRDYTDWQ